MIKAYSKDLPYSYIEGFFPTFELIQHKRESLKCVYVSQDALLSDGYKKLVNLLPSDMIITSDKAFSIAKTKENAHVLGVFSKFEDHLDPNQDHLVMVNPSDMGNLGNAMRTLLAFGCHDLALIKPCADKFNPKAVRASMGAIFKIRIQEFESYEAYLREYHRTCYPFVLQKSTPLAETIFVSPCSLVFGNEATGLPSSIYNEHNVRIEQSDEVDSLNLTTSIAVALYQLKIQKSR